MDISTAWPKSDIHTWIYPWIYPWQAWDVPHTDPIYPGHGNRRNSRTFGCMVRVGFQSGQTSLLQWSDKKSKLLPSDTFPGLKLCQNCFCGSPPSLDELTALRQTPSLVGCGGEDRFAVERKGKKREFEWINRKVRRTLNSICGVPRLLNLGYATGCLSVAYKTLCGLGTTVWGW